MNSTKKMVASMSVKEVIGWMLTCPESFNLMCIFSGRWMRRMAFCLMERVSAQLVMCAGITARFCAMEGMMLLARLLDWHIQ